MPPSTSMTRPTAPTTGSTEPTDAELLRQIARGTSDPERARRAQALVYERHVRYLYGAVLRMNPSLLEMAGLRPEDLVQETFGRAFDRSHTYDPGDAHDSEAQRRRTRAWLGRIASRLLADALRRPREIAASPLVDRAAPDSDRRSAPPSSRRRGRLAVVCEALEQLSDREQDVLRVSALYQKAGETHQRLPNEVSAELAERWGTTNENIRAIRSRAMKKLKAYLLSRGILQGEEA